MPKKKRHPKQSSSTVAGRADLIASLKIIRWLNATLDAAAKSVGKQAGRDAALTLLILDRNFKAKSGKKLLQSYRTWRGAHRSKAIDESLQVALGQLLRAGLVTVGKIRLTNKGHKRIEMMRRVIDQRLGKLRKSLTPRERRVFDKLIKESLEDPPPKPPRLK